MCELVWLVTSFFHTVRTIEPSKVRTSSSLVATQTVEPPTLLLVVLDFSVDDVQYTKPCKKTQFFQAYYWSSTTMACNILYSDQHD